MSLYSTIPAPRRRLASLLTAKPLSAPGPPARVRPPRSPRSAPGRPVAVGKLYNLATSPAADARRLAAPPLTFLRSSRADQGRGHDTSGRRRRGAARRAASGNNYFSLVRWRRGCALRPPAHGDSRQLGRCEWIATYEGLSIRRRRRIGRVESARARAARSRRELLGRPKFEASV